MQQSVAERWKEKRKKLSERTVFRTIFTSMLAEIVLVSALLVSVILATDVGGQLDNNAEELLQMQVNTRADYIEDILLEAQDLMALSDTVDAAVQTILDSGTVDLDTLVQGGSECDALMEQIAQELISTLRSKSVTGIFLILNTKDLNTCEVGTALPGIYLRDMDPDARPSARNSDLSLLRASTAVVKSLGLSTDKDWQPMFSYQGNHKNGILRDVFQTARADGAVLDEEDYGRWTTDTYRMGGDSYTAIAYSQPLILPDGTVYGVIGVEMLTEYLESKMPYTELREDMNGTYFLMSTTSDLEADTQELRKAVTSSCDERALTAPAGTVSCERTESGYWLEMGAHRYYAVVSSLNLYNRNAPFSSEQWVLVGTVEADILFAFSEKVMRAMISVVVVVIVLGITGSLLIADTLARPTNRLYREVIQAQEEHVFPQLSRTGIRELDRFAETITQLNQDLVNSSTKFLRIMEMASVELGGFELQYDTGSVFVTDNFFSLLGAPELDGERMSVRRFEEQLNHLQYVRPCTTKPNGDKLLTIRHEGTTRYTLLRVTTEGRALIGLAEDVTANTLERMRIEHERDFDILTGLYNRQAFNREAEALFAQPKELGCAALMMLDLDRLKHINDTYGHDWGDQYIRNTGQCLGSNTPTGTLCARLSGDEFIVLFYGYRDQQQVRQRIVQLQQALQQSVTVLPSGKEMRIGISGGVAWYPKDSEDLTTLKRYADFAMYRVKHGDRGQIVDFDPDLYEAEQNAARTRSEFHRLIKEERLSYYFQPIFSTRSGRAMAYEALMRSDLPSLRSPATIMAIAQEQGALYEIERLTMFNSAAAFTALIEQGKVEADAMLFVNSISSVCLTEEDTQRYRQSYSKLMKRLVVEIMETDELDVDVLEAKRQVPGFSGMFAMDDYGSGYSNKGTLLELAPRFIKVDIGIIRGIDQDPDKRQIVHNIVTYAHPRSMRIIAEGVENAEELRTVIELGVDLVQGFFLAKPAPEPQPISEQARAVIMGYNSTERIGQW